MPLNTETKPNLIDVSRLSLTGMYVQTEVKKTDIKRVRQAKKRDRYEHYEIDW